MIELLVILIIIGVLYFGYVNMNKNSAFDIKEDAVYFQQNKKLIAYASIVGIERDMTGSFQAKTMYFAYIITFTDEAGDTDSFRFYQALTDAAKWESLKAKVIRANPFAKINESIL